MFRRITALAALLLAALSTTLPAAAVPADPRGLMPGAAPGLTDQSGGCGDVPAGPLSLPDLVDLALCRNPATAVAWAANRSAAAQVGIARAAELPTASLSIGPAVTRTDSFGGQTFTLGNGVSFSATSNGTSFGTTANLAIDYLLFDFGGRKARIDNARAGQRAAFANFADALQTVALNTVTAFNTLQGDIAATTAAEASVAFARSSYDLASGRQRAGVATPADTLQARTSLAQAELTLAQARGNVRTAQGTLAVTVGLPPTTILDLAPTPPLGSSDRLSNDVTALITEAERLRPDLTAARANLDASRASLRAARSDTRPSVSASVSNNLSYANSSSDTNNASVGLSLSIPLFNGYDRTYRVTAAQSEVDRTAALLEQTRQQAGLDVFTNATALDTQISVLSTARELIASATASADIAQGRFKAGVGTFTDLLNAQSALASARQQLVSADFGVRNAQAQLARSVGSIGEAVDGMRSGAAMRSVR